MRKFKFKYSFALIAFMFMLAPFTSFADSDFKPGIIIGSSIIIGNNTTRAITSVEFNDGLLDIIGIDMLEDSEKPIFVLVTSSINNNGIDPVFFTPNFYDDNLIEVSVGTELTPGMYRVRILRKEVDDGLTDFMLPIGVKGDKGDTGPQGEQGPSGVGGLGLMNGDGVYIGTLMGYSYCASYGRRTLSVLTPQGYVVYIGCFSPISGNAHSLTTNDLATPHTYYTTTDYSGQMYITEIPTPFVKEIFKVYTVGENRTQSSKIVYTDGIPLDGLTMNSCSEKDAETPYFGTATSYQGTVYKVFENDSSVTGYPFSTSNLTIVNE